MKRINLTKGKFSLVDDSDWEMVSKYSWSFHHSGYAVRGKPQVSLHRFILNAKKGQLVDHINRNKLDNRKSNLRFCNQTQNLYNTKVKDGIFWRPDRSAWIVRLKVGKKRLYVGYFKTKNAALEARKDASLKYHKEFSPFYA